MNIGVFREELPRRAWRDEHCGAGLEMRPNPCHCRNVVRGDIRGLSNVCLDEPWTLGYRKHGASAEGNY